MGPREEEESGETKDVLEDPYTSLRGSCSSDTGVVGRGPAANPGVFTK